MKQGKALAVIRDMHDLVAQCGADCGNLQSVIPELLQCRRCFGGEPGAQYQAADQADHVFDPQQADGLMDGGDVATAAKNRRVGRLEHGNTQGQVFADDVVELLQRDIRVIAQSQQLVQHIRTRRDNQIFQELVTLVGTDQWRHAGGYEEMISIYFISLPANR